MSEQALKAHLRDQFHYTRWANDQIIEAMEEWDDPLPDRTLLLLSHLLRAQDVWLGRIQGEPNLPAIWAEDTLQECRTRAEQSAEAWLDFLQECSEEAFDKTISYQNSKGHPFENELRELCGHVVNHSTHHRAQIAMLLREAGGEPPATDYIFYARAGR